ncbi:MAG: glutamate synthase subunit alpha, partial [Spirochaetaceae bacterium]|nr:glutamate synthase subunit alpha [Spirochaetaceae bacterium]
RAGLIDLSRVLAQADEPLEWKKTRDTFNFELEKRLDLTKLVPSFEAKKNVGEVEIQSTDRTFGTILGSEIQKKSGGKLDDDSYVVSCSGGAGQSFGAFIPRGLTIKLTGDANDAFGKGLSGGKLVVIKPADFEGEADSNIIVGNVALFGATSGTAFINGVAGERFCVRNSGATVVAEGCGDHGLEYMTGGTAVILGKTGRNLCAGMSGGVAYILDEKHDLYKVLNHELVKSYDLDDEVTTLRGISDESRLRELIGQHAKETGSKKAKAILSDWKHYRTCFKKIIPNDYLRIMTEIYAEEEAGVKYDEAVLSAFKKVTA